MKKTLIISLAVFVASFLLLGTAYAAVVNVTSLMGGNAGDIFVLDGKFNPTSLKVAKKSKLLGKLEVGKKATFKKNVKINGKLYGVGAKQINYGNAISGLAANNVKDAIDELASNSTQTVSNFFTAPSTWNATVYAVGGDGSYSEQTQIGGTNLVVTFTPTSNTQGTYTATFNVNNGTTNTAESGNYWLAGDKLLMYDTDHNSERKLDLSVSGTNQMSYNTLSTARVIVWNMQ